MGGIGEKKFNWLRQKTGQKIKRHSRRRILIGKKRRRKCEIWGKNKKIFRGGGEEKFGYTRSTEHSMQLGSKNTKYLLSCTVGLS